MKLISYRHAGRTEVGALGPDDRVVRLDTAHRLLRGRAQAHFDDMVAFLRGDREARELAATLIDDVGRSGVEEALTTLADITLLAPVPVPESIREFMNILGGERATAVEAALDPLAEQYVIDCTRKFGVGPWRRSLSDGWYERPICCKGSRFPVVGHGRDVVIPRCAKVFDYELEFGVFLSRGGRDVTAARAQELIGGYVVFNDFSARDSHGRELLRRAASGGADGDSSNAMGPVLVTPDELPDPYALTMRARINGQETRRSTSAGMRFRFEDVIAYVSEQETLLPGEFFGSGVCSGAQGGVDDAQDHRFLKEGDVVELEVEGLGVLRNRVVSEGHA